MIRSAAACAVSNVPARVHHPETRPPTVGRRCHRLDDRLVVTVGGQVAAAAGDPARSTRHAVVRASCVCDDRSVESAGNGRIARLRSTFDDRLAAQDLTHPGYRAAFEVFARSLLEHDGDLVVPPVDPDILLGPIAEMGEVRPTDRLQVRPMQANDCHINAAVLWRAGEVPSIGTGYAMSDDRLWREHSWGVTSEGLIVETTVQRATYFGFVFEGPSACWFADWILPLDTQ